MYQSRTEGHALDYRGHLLTVTQYQRIWGMSIGPISAEFSRPAPRRDAALLQIAKSKRLVLQCQALLARPDPIMLGRQKLTPMAKNSS